MEWMNPIYLQRQPSMLGVSEPFGSKQSIAFVDQGHLVYLERTFGEVPLGVGTIGLKVEAALLSSPMAIAAVERRIFASSSSGLTEYGIGADGSVSIQVPSPAGCQSYMYNPVAHRHLRNNAGIQGVIAFSDSPDAGFSVLVPSACNVNLDFDFLGPHVAPLRINDMAALLVPKADGGHPDDECYLLADSRGLWAGDFDNTSGDFYPFVPIDSPLFPNRSCGASSDQQIVGIKVTAAEFLVVRSQVVDGGPTESLSIASLKPLIAGGVKPCYTTRPCRSTAAGLPIRQTGV